MTVFKRDITPAEYLALQTKKVVTRCPHTGCEGELTGTGDGGIANDGVTHWTGLCCTTCYRSYRLLEETKEKRDEEGADPNDDLGDWRVLLG